MSLAKDLGSRHKCWKCETKFYDLHKPSPSCPKCGTDPRENPALRAASPKAKKAERLRAEEREEEELDDLGGDDDDTLLEDEDDLPDDDDDY